MRHGKAWVAFLSLVLGAGLWAGIALAGTVTVQTVLEGRSTDGSGRSALLLVGKGLKGVDHLHLEPPPGGDASLPTVDLPLGSVAGSTLATFVDVDGNLVSGEYRVTLVLRNGSQMDAGSVRLAAGGLLPGTTIDVATFSAYADLMDEARIGLAASQIAPGNHNHDADYSPLSHNHDAAYLGLAGGSLTGTLSGSVASGRALVGATSASSASIVATTTPAGVAGQSTATANCGVGVLGTAASAGGAGVYGENTSTAGGYCVGVFGVSVSPTGAGVYGVNTATSGGTCGIFGTAGSSSGTGVYAEAYGTGTALRANHIGASGDIAQFQSGGSTEASIDKTGKGWFNGGTATGGADFAESVVVDAPKAEFEPGDVIVIDPASPRRFAKSSKAGSPLVAGVHATRPGVLARLGDVARTEDWMAREVPMAVVGIVPTKVCDEGGAVEIGDMLVTASLPGYAKKAPPRPEPGTVLGKALGEMRAERGTVEVLLGAAR